MRYLLFGTITLLNALHSLAQSNLSGSSRYSRYTYVYRLDAKEADTLTTAGIEKHLHTRVDSFLTGAHVRVLKPGNYLLVHADGNKLAYRLYTPRNLEVKTISNDHDLSIAVHTKEGALIDDATVLVNNRPLAYNAATKTYGVITPEKEGTVKVYHNNTSYTFPLEEKDSYRPYYRKPWYRSPFKHIASLFRKKHRRKQNYYYGSYFNGNTPYEQQFKGFMVFNKPKYKPGDTVFMKAFVETAAGKPVNKPLVLRLSGRDFEPDTILATIRPYRPGGYTYQFILSDSLELRLDDQYMLTLEEERSRKYDVNEYDGDLDEDEYAGKREVLMRGRFEYEEYELSSVTFKARGNKQTHTRGEQLSIFLKAVDENEMPVMDGRVNILITPNGYGATYFRAPSVYLKDTLWTHSQALESVGETRIDIPDSIFPRADFDFSIYCTFLNSNNERREQTLRQTYHASPGSISFELGNDSLAINYLLSGKPAPQTGMLYVTGNAEDTIETHSISMPAVIRVNPFAAAYAVQTDSVTDSYSLSKDKGQVSCLSLMTHDSVEVQLVNPRRLAVWYTVFAGNKIVLRGYGDTLHYRERITKPSNYFVSLQYVYGDQVHKENYTIPYLDKQLTIETDQPESIYPGQQLQVGIHVTDFKGNAVPGADITAYGYTGKFKDAAAPFVPYLGKPYPYRKLYHFPGLKEKEAQELAAALNWQRWSREMQLDTIEYYKFLHPESIYINREPAADGNSQIAPFVVDKGALQPVHLIYIDEAPVFFSQAHHMQRYSFRIWPGRHNIRLRTADKLITLDSVWITSGMKTFLSVDVNTTNRHVHVMPQPNELTEYETRLWSQYMLLINNTFGENLGYVKQYGNYFLLNKGGNAGSSPILTGPFSNAAGTLVVKDKFKQDFTAEGGWEYTISPGLIKQKQYSQYQLFQSKLSEAEPYPQFDDLVLTEKEIDSLWQDYLDNRSSNTSLFSNNNIFGAGVGRLLIGSPVDADNKHLFIKNIILFRNDDPDYIEIYTGIRRDFGYLKPGKYRLLFLLKKDRYFIKDSITVLPNGINYYETGYIAEKPADSTSSNIARIIENRSKKDAWSPATTDLNRIKETFNDKYLDQSVFTEVINGVVLDEQDGPLPGVTIVVKGTRVGTVTDAKGSFSMRVPPKATIVINFVGYMPREIRIEPQRYYNIRLDPSKAALQEVVVTGYATTQKKALSYSTSTVSTQTLQGKVAGVIVRGASRNNDSIAPMVIVDGLPYNGRFEDLDPGLLNNVRVLKGEEATSLFGSRAAAGVIVVTTKNGSGKAADIPVQGNTLRHNFRDHAYWQPALVTDANGNASFRATFPDDITSWRTFFIGMTGNRQSGFVEKTVRAFKSLSSNINLPQFAVKGDTMHVIGKTLNYLSDSITAKRAFSVNNTLFSENEIHLYNSWIDTFAVIAGDRDSLKLKYTIQMPNGYFDGEERDIPVYPQGVLATSGIFAALYKDTSFRLKLEPDTGTIQLYAESSLLPVLYEETESIRKYEYLCNEQLASKLKALLIQKKIDEYLNRPFKRDKNIREIIKKLIDGKSQAGLWGWWANTQYSMWISLHAMEALLEAEKNGYTVPLDKRMLTDYLVFNQESTYGTEKLSSLYLLKQLDAGVNYKAYVDSIEKQRLRIRHISLYEQLRLVELKQKLGFPVVLDSFINKQQRTVFGNTYWGDDGYSFFDNSVQITLCMYRILRNAGGYESLLQKTLSWFLEQRKTGCWRNTYESSLILETILPDLLAADPDLKPASLVIHSEERLSVTSFPFSREIKAGDPVTITKQGRMPVYFTAYRRYWDENPVKASGNFEVSSYFEQNGQPVALLKAGTPVELKVKVTVKADADYVMVEVPIPAGCSYRDKEYNRWREVHREYFKNKVSIFCSSLTRGEHEFTISLLPRYTGTYTLNPAKAEMMYFPIFNGREAIRKVTIK